MKKIYLFLSKAIFFVFVVVEEKIPDIINFGVNTLHILLDDRKGIQHSSL